MLREVLEGTNRFARREHRIKDGVSAIALAIVLTAGVEAQRRDVPTTVAIEIVTAVNLAGQVVGDTMYTVRMFASDRSGEFSRWIRP